MVSIGGDNKLGIKLNGKIVVTKSVNNNIVLVKIDGKEKILFSKGIGFGKKFGENIANGTEVEKVFTIEDEDNIRNFNKLVDTLDEYFVGVCEEAIYEISNQVECELNENIHVALLSHLSFAIKRLENDEEIQNPFIVEIQTLYPREYELASMVAEKVGTNMKISIPEGEVGFIALHIHSAINDGKLSNTIKYSYLSSKVIEHVEYRLKININRKSLDYARFLTHIRFAIERIITNSPIKNDLIDVIRIKYKQSYSIAKEIGEIIKSQLSLDVSEDEVAYLAMHIERFRVSIKK